MNSNFILKWEKEILLPLPGVSKGVKGISESYIGQYGEKVECERVLLLVVVVVLFSVVSCSS